MVKEYQKLVNREIGTIERFQQMFTNPRELYGPLMTVLLAPVTFEIDQETSEKKTIFEKFDSSKLDFRNEMIDNMKAVDVMSCITFFLNSRLN